MKRFKEVRPVDVIFTLMMVVVLVCGVASFAANAARPAFTPQRVDIIANTAYSDAAGEFCVVTVGRETSAYLGPCNVVAQEIYGQIRAEYPLMAVTVTINGNEVNRI